MPQHFITKCSCGNVIAQCRCPSPDKVVNVVERGCERCHGSRANVKFNRDQNEWVIHDSQGQFVILTPEDWRYINSVIHEHYHGDD